MLHSIVDFIKKKKKIIQVGLRQLQKSLKNLDLGVRDKLRGIQSGRDSPWFEDERAA